MNFREKIIASHEAIKRFGNQSLSKLSRHTNSSKSSAYRQKKAIDFGSSHIGSEFFQTENGYSWMLRLIIGILFIFGIKCNIGAETIALFFSLIGFDIYVGLSPASINRLETYIRELLKKYEEQLKPVLNKLAQEKDLIGGADETFFNRFMILVFMDLPSGFLFREKITTDRQFSTWNKETSEHIKPFKRFLCLVSDRAQALLKLGTHHGCAGIADLFHFLMKPVRLFKFSFARKLTTLKKEEEQLTLALKTANTKSDADAITERLKVINEECQVIKKGQAQYRHELQTISTTVHPFSLDLQQQTTQQISVKLKDSVLSLQNVLTSCAINDKKNILKKMEKQIEPIAKLTDLWRQWLETDLNDKGVRTELCDALKEFVLPVVYFKLQIRKSKSNKSLRKIYQSAYLEAEKKLISHPLVSELSSSTWINWAEKMCRKYQRTTSAIEGRNGLLSGFNLCARGIAEEQLESQTIISNYWIKQHDGTTAVERCFGLKPDIDLFEFIVTNMRELPLPRRREKRNGNLFIQGHLLAVS